MDFIVLSEEGIQPASLLILFSSVSSQHDIQNIEEIMARVRQLELRAKKLVQESFAGEYHSSFKGQGLDFDEFREYQHGDEIRFIDWKVTARLGSPYIRKFREERELSAILAVDLSASMNYGSVHFSKREIAAEVAALIAFAARDNGCLLYTSPSPRDRG